MSDSHPLDGLVEAIALRVCELMRADLAALRDGEAATPTSSELKKEELARELRVSTATVERYVREGMPHTRVGVSKRFDLEACRAWAATPREPKPAPVRETKLDGIRPLTRQRKVG